MKARKVLPRTALPRIYFIDKKIAAGTYPSTKTLADEWETSMSSISRDIAFMKDMLNAPVEYDALRRGYYYSEETFRLPSAYASPEDMQALGISKTLLSIYQDTPLYDAARRLLETITAPLAGQKNPEWYKNRIIAPPAASVIILPDVWGTVIDGLRDNAVITFEYRGAWDDEFKKRRIRPYQLLFDSGVWYLYAYAEERKAIRIFSLSRMRNAKLCADTFTLPEDYDYCTQVSGSHFGIFIGDKKYRFSVIFYDESALFARERQWAADQDFEECEDGVIISFTSTQYSKVLEWVLSQGCNSLPLAPERLVKDWKLHIDEMKKLAYRRPTKDGQ
jgi:hypothetical protein